MILDSRLFGKGTWDVGDYSPLLGLPTS